MMRLRTVWERHALNVTFNPRTINEQSLIQNFVYDRLAQAALEPISVSMISGHGLMTHVFYFANGDMDRAEDFSQALAREVNVGSGRAASVRALRKAPLPVPRTRRPCV